VREDEEVLLDRERRVEIVELRDDAAAGACLLRLAGQSEAEDVQLSLVGDRLRREEPHGRRLARAVRAEQPDARAEGHLEVEVVDGGDRAVALHHPAHADRKLVGHPSRMPAT
jgi:hypothetical protein